MPDGSDDRHVALTVGPEHRDAESRHLGEQHRRRMSVVVVRADADDRERRMRGGEKGRVGVRRAVMRDLEDVRAQVGARGDERALRLDLRIPGQQDPHATDIGPQHQGRVVGVRAGAVKRGDRPEHIQVHATHVQ
jgi:hypothetical protein